jgi:hypothetical protein
LRSSVWDLVVSSAGFCLPTAVRMLSSLTAAPLLHQLPRLCRSRCSHLASAATVFQLH